MSQLDAITRTRFEKCYIKGSFKLRPLDTFRFLPFLPPYVDLLTNVLTPSLPPPNKLATFEQIN